MSSTTQIPEKRQGRGRVDKTRIDGITQQADRARERDDIRIYITQQEKREREIQHKDTHHTARERNIKHKDTHHTAREEREREMI